MWNKSIISSLIKEHESPWEIEIRGSIRSFELVERFYTLKNINSTPICYGKKKGLTWGVVRGKWIYDDVVSLFAENGIIVDFEKRGFFNPNSDNKFVVENSSIKRDIDSYGVYLWLKINLWRVFRTVQKILNKPYDVDYVAFRRHREANK